MTDVWCGGAVGGAGWSMPVQSVHQSAAFVGGGDGGMSVEDYDGGWGSLWRRSIILMRPLASIPISINQYINRSID